MGSPACPLGPAMCRGRAPSKFSAQSARTYTIRARNTRCCIPALPGLTDLLLSGQSPNGVDALATQLILGSNGATSNSTRCSHCCVQGVGIQACCFASSSGSLTVGYQHRRHDAPFPDVLIYVDQGNVDGAFFGTTFPHLLLMTYPSVRPQRPPEQYMPRVFGFKLHSSALATTEGQHGGSHSNSVAVSRPLRPLTVR